MTIPALLVALAVCALIARSFIRALRRRDASRYLAAYTRGYGQAHDDIYQALTATPSKARRRLDREARRQRSQAGFQ